MNAHILVLHLQHENVWMSKCLRNAGSIMEMRSTRTQFYRSIPVRTLPFQVHSPLWHKWPTIGQNVFTFAPLKRKSLTAWKSFFFFRPHTTDVHTEIQNTQYRLRKGQLLDPIYILGKLLRVQVCACFRFKINNAVGQMFMLMKINEPFIALISVLRMWAKQCDRTVCMHVQYVCIAMEKCTAVAGEEAASDLNHNPKCVLQSL